MDAVMAIIGGVLLFAAGLTLFLICMSLMSGCRGSAGDKRYTTDANGMPLEKRTDQQRLDDDDA